jgi:cysteinyl-tRNA synthetase
MEDTKNRAPMDHGFYADNLEQARVNLWPLLDDLNTSLQMGANIEGVPERNSGLFAMASALEKGLTNPDSNPKYLAWLRASIKQAADILGILQQDPEAWFKQGASDDLTAQVEALLVERAAARAAKNWPESDRIRDALNALNVEVMDGPTGATWKVKGK